MEREKVCDEACQAADMPLEASPGDQGWRFHPGAVVADAFPVENALVREPLAVVSRTMTEGPDGVRRQYTAQSLVTGLEDTVEEVEVVEYPTIPPHLVSLVIALATQTQVRDAKRAAYREGVDAGKAGKEVS